MANSIRQKLIAADLWDINDTRDPSIVPTACDDLELRCQEEFPQTKTWIISYVGLATDNLPYRIYLPDEAEVFATEATRARVICEAALRLARHRSQQQPPPDSH